MLYSMAVLGGASGGNILIGGSQHYYVRGTTLQALLRYLDTMIVGLFWVVEFSFLQPLP